MPAWGWVLAGVGCVVVGVAGAWFALWVWANWRIWGDDR